MSEHDYWERMHSARIRRQGIRCVYRRNCFVCVLLSLLQYEISREAVLQIHTSAFAFCEPLSNMVTSNYHAEIRTQCNDHLAKR